MFDIGFWEILLIGTIALIVIGPDRLPSVARTMGRAVGKINHFVGKFKDDINLELKTKELKETLAKQKESIGIHEIIDDLKDDKNSIRDELLTDADPEELAKLDLLDGPNEVEKLEESNKIIKSTKLTKSKMDK